MLNKILIIFDYLGLFVNFSFKGVDEWIIGSHCIWKGDLRLREFPQFFVDETKGLLDASEVGLDALVANCDCEEVLGIEFHQ